MDQTGPGHQPSSAEKEGRPADEKMPRVGHSTALKDVVNGDDLLRDNEEMDEDAIPTQVQRLNGSASCEETDSRITVSEGHVTVIKQADAQIHRVTGDDGGREYTVGADDGVPSLVQDDRLTIETLVLDKDAKTSSDASPAGYDSRLVEEAALDASDMFSTAQGEMLEFKEDLLEDSIGEKARTEEVVKGDGKDEKLSEQEIVVDSGEVKHVTLGKEMAVSEAAEVTKEAHESPELIMNGTVMKVSEIGEVAAGSEDREMSKMPAETEVTSSIKEEQVTLVDVSIPHTSAKLEEEHVEKEELDETVEPAVEAVEVDGMENKIDDTREYETAITPTIDDIDHLKTTQLIENEEPVSLEQIVLEESKITEVTPSDHVHDEKTETVSLMEKEIAEVIDEDHKPKESKEKISDESLKETKGVTDLGSKEDERYISGDKKEELEIEKTTEITKVDDVESAPEPVKKVDDDMPEREGNGDVEGKESPAVVDKSEKPDIEEKPKEVVVEKEEIQMSDEKEDVDTVERKLIDAIDSRKEDKLTSEEPMEKAGETGDMKEERYIKEEVKQPLDAEGLAEKSVTSSDEIKIDASIEVSVESKITPKELSVESKIQDQEIVSASEIHIASDSNKIASEEPMEKAGEKGDMKEDGDIKEEVKQPLDIEKLTEKSVTSDEVGIDVSKEVSGEKGDMKEERDIKEEVSQLLDTKELAEKDVTSSDEVRIDTSKEISVESKITPKETSVESKIQDQEIVSASEMHIDSDSNKMASEEPMEKEKGDICVKEEQRDIKEEIKQPVDTEELAEKSVTSSDEVGIDASKEVSVESKIQDQEIVSVSGDRQSVSEEMHIGSDSNKIESEEPMEQVSEEGVICVKEEQGDIKEKGIEEETEEKEKDTLKEKDIDMESFKEDEHDLSKPCETVEDISGSELTEKESVEEEIETAREIKEELLQEKESGLDDAKYDKEEEEKQVELEPEEHMKEPQIEQQEMQDSGKYDEPSEKKEKDTMVPTQREDIIQEEEIKKETDNQYYEEREKEVEEEKLGKTAVDEDHEKVILEEKTQPDMIGVQDSKETKDELSKDKEEIIETKYDEIKQEDYGIPDNKLEEKKHEIDTEETVDKESIDILEDHEEVKESSGEEGIVEKGKEEKYEQDKKEDTLEGKVEAEQKQVEITTRKETTEEKTDDSEIQGEEEKHEKEEAKDSGIDINELDTKCDEEKLDELSKDKTEKPVSAADVEEEQEKVKDEEIVEKVKETMEEEKEMEVEKIHEIQKEEKELDVEEITEKDKEVEGVEAAAGEVEEAEEIAEVELEKEEKEKVIEISEKVEKAEIIEDKQAEEAEEIQSAGEEQETMKADEIEVEEEKGSIEAEEKKEEIPTEKDKEKEEEAEEQEVEKEEEIDMKEGIVDGELESPETIPTAEEPIKEYIAEVEVPKLEEKIEDVPAEEPKEEKPEGTKEVTVKPTKKSKEKKSKKDDLPKSPSKRRTGRTPPRSLYKKDGAHTGDSTKQARTPTSPKKPLTTAKTTPSPKKTPPARNGMTSPARTPSSEGKKIPPIKAPVGQAPNPNLKNIKSKIGSLDNIKHKPGGGERKVSTQKLEWQASSKIGSLEKASHKPGGGDKKIQVQKVDFKDKAQSKVGSRDNIKHVPGGGSGKTEHAQDQRADGRIETYKTDFKQKAASKVGSLENVKHKPGGGNVQIRSDKLNFKERAASKIGSLSGSEKGSTHGSDTQSPIPPSSPVGDDEPGTSMPPVAENGEENGISPVDGRADEEATPETPEAPGDAMSSPQAAQC